MRIRIGNTWGNDKGSYENKMEVNICLSNIETHCDKFKRIGGQNRNEMHIRYLNDMELGVNI